MHPDSKVLCTAQKAGNESQALFHSLTSASAEHKELSPNIVISSTITVSSVRHPSKNISILHCTQLMVGRKTGYVAIQ